MDKAKLLARQTEILREMEEIDKADSSAGKNYLENERFQELDTELRQIHCDIEVCDAVQADRDRRAGFLPPPEDDPLAKPAKPPENKRSFGEFLVDVIRAGKPGGEKRAPTGLGSISGPDGGYLIHQETTNTIWEKVNNEGAIINRCWQIPIGPNANGTEIPYLKENARTDGYAYGGVQVYWSKEAGTVTATKPAIDKWELNLLKMTGIVYLTEENMEDAPQMESLVMRLLPKAMRMKMEDSIFWGEGVGYPLGILNSKAPFVTVTKETSQTATTFNLANVAKMYSRLYPANIGGARWYHNQDVLPQFIQLNTVAAGSGQPMYYQPGGIGAAPNGAILGRPLEPCEHCETLGTLGDVVLADFGEYVIVQKGGIRSASSIHVQFLYGESVLRFTWRINGRPFWPAALTPRKGSNTQSPFVALADRS